VRKRAGGANFEQTRSLTSGYVSDVQILGVPSKIRTLPRPSQHYEKNARLATLGKGPKEGSPRWGVRQDALIETKGQTQSKS